MWEVSAFKAPSWQRIDIAFHSATHSVTWLPFPPQGLLSWELACQPETMWVGGVRFDWDVEQLEEERGARKSHWGCVLKWLWLPCCSVNAKLLCGEFLFLCSCEWNVCATASTLAFIVSWAYCRMIYLFNLCCLWAHAMNHEAVRQYIWSMIIIALAPCIDQENTTQLPSSSAKPSRPNTHFCPCTVSARSHKQSRLWQSI